ncbi:MAG: 3-oxoacyl-[acyl-carrier protein] reductase, partial [Candidatus Azotimanducaceae bacterium]
MAAVSGTIADMDLQLSAKRVIVTGASKGIGLAIARAFLVEGAEVAICARNADDLV